MSARPSTIVLMGVCGCGKTAVGRLLAARIGASFEDADDFHTDAAREKMRSGLPLTDDDRWPWYARLRARVLEKRAEGRAYILACSALKRAYRDRLRDGDGPDAMVFIHLDGAFDLIRDRMSRREGHYMPLSLLESQFAILERSDDIIPVSIEGTPEEIAGSVAAVIGGDQI